MCARRGPGFSTSGRDRQAGIQPAVISHGYNTPPPGRSRSTRSSTGPAPAIPRPGCACPEAIGFLASLRRRHGRPDAAQTAWRSRAGDCCAIGRGRAPLPRRDARHHAAPHCRWAQTRRYRTRPTRRTQRYRTRRRHRKAHCPRASRCLRTANAIAGGARTGSAVLLLAQAAAPLVPHLREGIQHAYAIRRLADVLAKLL